MICCVVFVCNWRVRAFTASKGGQARPLTPWPLITFSSKLGLAVVHAFNPSIWEEQRGKSLDCSRITLSTQ